MAQKRTRPIQELANALRGHVRLLTDYAEKAFKENDDIYFGEVAGKLRLLVCKSGSNRPLLNTLMHKLGINDIQITLGGPRLKRYGKEPISGDRISLNDFMKLTAFGTRTPSHGFVSVSKQELIAMVSQQIGASHEAWELDERLLGVLNSAFLVNNRPSIISELEITTSTVLRVANKVLVHPKFIDAARQ